jgi:hypothetical protein
VTGHSTVEWQHIYRKKHYLFFFCCVKLFGDIIIIIIIIMSSSSSISILCGPVSSVGIATGYGLRGPGIESRWGEIFRTYPDRPRDPPSLLYNVYRVFPGGRNRPGRDTDPSPPSSAEV